MEPGLFDSELYSATMLLWGAICIILPLILTFFGALLLPGRKGYMRTKREVLWPGLSAEETLARLDERFAQLGFTPVAGATRYTVERKKGQSPDDYLNESHANKPLRAEFTFSPEGQGVRIGVVMTMPDFVILDTGEGAHIDQVLDRLLATEACPPLRPPVPNVSYMAAVCWSSGICQWAAVIAIAMNQGPLAKTAGAFFGLAFGAFVYGVAGFLALALMYRRPLEVKGRALAIAGVFCCVACPLIAMLLAYHQHAGALETEGFVDFVGQSLALIEADRDYYSGG